MDDERRRKIQAGREKLSAYKKRKVTDSDRSSQSDTSLSLSPLPLSEPKKPENVSNSGSSSISENIELTNSENDRSFQEITIGNVLQKNQDGTHSRDILLNNNEMMLNCSGSSFCSTVSLNALARFELENNFGEPNVLSEIISGDRFDVKPEDEVASAAKDARRRLSTEDSWKEPTSNPSTISLGTSTTEYKQYYEKINTGAIEFQDILTHRDEHIKQLTEALQQVLEDRNNLQEQTDYFAQEIAVLKEQLVQTTAIIKKNNLNSSSLNCDATKISFDFEDPDLCEKLTPEEQKIVMDLKMKVNAYIEKKVDEFKKGMDLLKNQTSPNNKPQISNFDLNDSSFDETFSPEELSVISDLRSKIYLFIQQKINNYKNANDLELKALKDRFESEKLAHTSEVEKFRQLLVSVKSGSIEIDDLRQELNEKHNKEMEELRTYFEQKCADLEKHYSDEVNSHQSRKLSGSSVCSELDSEIYPPVGPSGDAVSILPESLKSEVGLLKIELQNKYHAELEILREDYENRLDELRINQDNVVQEYVTQIEGLRLELQDMRKRTAAIQEVASSGDFEIAEVVESYERRLQEQIMLAKVDIIYALEQQIQTIVSSPIDDVEWPSELLQLRDRLIYYRNSEIEDLKQQHAEEINLLKEEHEKNLTRAIERERRNSVKSGDEADIRKERDNLKKATSNLRHLVAELIKYFTKCEDALNNTLVEELLKYGFDKDSSRIDSDLNDSCHSGSDQLDAFISPRIKRVHFTPDVPAIINLINDSSDNIDVSIEFQTELDLCLERLKSEANAILSLTTNLKSQPTDVTKVDKPQPVDVTINKSPPTDVSQTTSTDEKLSSLTRQLIAETQAKNTLTTQVEESQCYIRGLEAEKQSLEVQLEQMVAKQQVLVLELNGARAKINDLIESGRKEIVSEGYGENQIMGSATLGGRIASLAELQERARTLLAEANIDPMLVQLVEELCREGDRIMEDAKKDHDELVQQIEAADKKLRATTQFLEEQAIERECERDDAQKEIATLREQLRCGERTRASCERIHNEETKGLKQNANANACCCDFHNNFMESVEHLEVQMREMTLLMAECETKKNEVENELKEAIDKIWVLRDIIRDLEAQIEDKTKTEVELKNIVVQLEEKIREEARHCEELCRQVEELRSRGEDSEVVRRLEAENQKLRVSSELVGPDGVLKQVKTQLSDIERILEKRTKDLEALHIVVSNTNCSSPSEDMSLRDQIRPASTSDADSDLPLEQLARLKDKLIRHARAEDAATKRIRDLEMQLFTAKQEHDEIQSERDVLQDQLSEQMVLISSLQLRLDDQRLRAETAQKQTNTSLEHKIYDLETEIQDLKETVHNRDKNIKQLNTIVEQTKKRLADQQKQLNTASDLEKQIVEKLQEEIKDLRVENGKLKKNVDLGSSAKALTSDVYDTMLADKNAEIERIRMRLSDVEKELSFYMSKELSMPKSSNMTSLIGTNEIDPPRKQDQIYDSINSVEPLDFKRNVNETPFIGSTFRDSKQEAALPFIVQELSSIEKVGVTLTVADCQLKQGDSLSLKCKHVHFEDSFADGLDALRHKVELAEEKRNLKYAEFNEEVDALKRIAKDLRVELAQAKLCLEQKSTKLEVLEKDYERKDQMYLSLVKVKRDLEHQIEDLERKFSKLRDLEGVMEEKNQEVNGLKQEIEDLKRKQSKVRDLEGLMEQKNQEIYDLEQQLAQVEDLDVKDQIKQKEVELDQLKAKQTELEQQLEEKITKLSQLTASFDQLKQELSTKNELLFKHEKEQRNILAQCNDLSVQVSNLKQILDEKTKGMEALEEKLKQELEISKNQKKVEMQSSDLSLEVSNLRQILEERTKVIQKMEEELKQFQGGDNAKELEVSKNQKELAEKNLQLIRNKEELQRLNKDVQNLQELLNEKDKVINQMTVDSNSLHASLEAIQSKIQESGNVVDLKKRLREEQILSTALREEVNILKQSVEQSEFNQLKQRLVTEEDQVKKLQHLLDEEKLNSNVVQLQDANIIESMRLKLEALLDHEKESESLLKTEKQAREQLEKQLLDVTKRTESLSLDSSTKKNANFEVTCLKMDLVKVSTENEILKSELNTIRNLHLLVKSELKQVRDLDDMQKMEVKELRKLLQSAKDDKQRKSENAAEANKQVILEMEEERKQMKKHIDDLNNNVRKLHDREKDLKQLLLMEQQKQMNSQVPEKFLNKIKELTSLLQGHIADNKQMSNTLAHLTEERRLLQSKVRELEDRLSLKAPFDDPAARADHLFGRYLKSESYRKALIFQKRYLLTLLVSYQQNSCTNVAPIKFVLPHLQQTKPLSRFRAVVYTIISVHRMRYIVQRWHTGKRIGASVVLKRPVVPTASSVDSRPWSGNSPPCRERTNLRTELPLGNTIQESIMLAPLQAPALLSQYIERFDSIQQRLGLALDRTAN